jgi:hypothetical protein
VQRANRACRNDGSRESSIAVLRAVLLAVHREGACHLTTTAIADCACSVESQSPRVFHDYNVYHRGRMKWLGTDYGSDAWDAFRAKALHDEHSQIAPVEIADDGTVSFPPESPAPNIGKKVGPTEPVRLGPDR